MNPWVTLVGALLAAGGDAVVKALEHHGFRRVEDVRPETGRAAAAVADLESAPKPSDR